MKPDGGPAFPLHIPYSEWREPGGGRTQSASTARGMTLRDAFAIGAIPAAITSADGKTTPGVLANWVYRIADAMLAERSK